MRIAALTLLAGILGCGDATCVRFDGDDGLRAGACSDGEACQSFARACRPATDCAGEDCG